MTRYTLRQRFLRFLGAYVETVAIWLMDKADISPAKSEQEKYIESVGARNREIEKLFGGLQFPTLDELGIVWLGNQEVEVVDNPFRELLIRKGYRFFNGIPFP